MKLLPRLAERSLKRLLRVFPAVLIHGPRQSGKSTLVKMALPNWSHLDLEKPRDAALFDADLQGTLEGIPKQLAIDEAQRRPELFTALRAMIDAGPSKGRYVLLGSASPALLKNVSESLAGRVGTLELTPFLATELLGRRGSKERWFWGGFPPVHGLREHLARVDWLDAYINTVIERDLPGLGLLLPPTRLRLLLQMLTHVHGNLLNVSDLARSLAVSVPTVARDLDVLEGVFLIRRLYPYAANIQKRLSKSPKIYLRDTGVLHVAAGLHRSAELQTWARRGASYEGMVIEEIIALTQTRTTRPGYFFWRTEAGAEVDLIIVDGQRIIPIEIKLGGTVDGHALRGLRSCMQDLKVERGWVVTGAGGRVSVGRDIEIVPFDAVTSGACDFGIGMRGR